MLQKVLKVMLMPLHFLNFLLVFGILFATGRSSNGAVNSSAYLNKPDVFAEYVVQRVASISSLGMTSSFQYAHIFLPFSSQATNEEKQYFERNVVLVCPETQDFHFHTILDTRPRFYGDRDSGRYNYMPIPFRTIIATTVTSTKPIASIAIMDHPKSTTHSTTQVSTQIIILTTIALQC